MSVLVSSWSGPNSTRGHFMVQKPTATVQVCQSPPASRKGWLHPDCLWGKIPQPYELPAGDWDRSRWFGPKVVPGIILTTESKF